MKNKLILRIAAVSSAFIMAGCATDISVTLPPATQPPEESQTTALTTRIPESSTTETTTQTTTEETTTETPETTPEATTELPAETADTGLGITETYKKYVLSDEYNDFISKCVFVGDSICSGLKAHDILPADHVLAKGNVAARNIFDFSFKLNGSEMSLLSALVDLKPEYVVFSMGMNDVNMTSQQKFCENYEYLLSQVHSFVPDATLIVCSVTPVTYTCKFTSNENIDSFNAALKEYLDSTKDWIYADITHELKNDLNALKTQYDGAGDGIHLANAAYYAILYQLGERMVDGLVYENGEMVKITTTEAETSASSVTSDSAAPETESTEDTTHTPDNTTSGSDSEIEPHFVE